MYINKNTRSNEREIIRGAVRDAYGSEDSYMEDYDSEYVYLERWNNQRGYVHFKIAYNMSEDFKVTFTGEPVEVLKLTEYKDVVKSNEDSLLKKLEKLIKDNLGTKQHPIIKQFDDEEMIAIEPLYVSVGEVDGHGDMIESMEEMEALVKSFNEANEAGNLQSSFFHKHKTDKFSILKAWVNQVDCMIGDSLVPEGQPIVKIKFNDSKAWNLRKEGKLQGVSIGARAMEVEEVQ